MSSGLRSAQPCIATVLYYYRARYYSPSLGRFLQTDPIGIKDDINLYAYVQNDPLNKNDPTGAVVVRAGGLIRPWRPPPQPKVPKVVVIIVGKNKADVAKVKAATERVLATPRGRDMEAQALSTDKTEKIVVNNKAKNEATRTIFGVTGDAYIDPNSVSAIPISTTEGSVPLTLERAVAHELGHSIMGDFDDGPGRMNNVKANENPVVTNLEPPQPERVQY